MPRFQGFSESVSATLPQLFRETTWRFRAAFAMLAELVRLEPPPDDWTPPGRAEMRERRKIRFRWIRANYGMSQEEMGEHFGTTDRSWRSYEKAGARPNHELLAVIAEETELSPAWILGEV